MSKLSRMIRKTIWSKPVFEFWQRLGVHVTRKHYYSPIPDTKELHAKKTLWERQTDLVGINFFPEKQLHLLQEVFSKYASEFDFPTERAEIPYEYYLNNAEFGLEDGLVLYCMIRHFKPKNIIEVGSGNSTMMGARACLTNKQDAIESRYVSIEPYPRKFLMDGFPGLAGQVKRKVEDLDYDFFDQLGKNDILFIDSSHVLRTGNDVQYLYLEILPRLKEGVIVHIHDIFLPYEYPQQWVVENRVFWSEQYLLQAFLTLNPCFEVLFGNYFMTQNYAEEMGAVFSHPPGYRQRNVPDSFWIRRLNK